MSNISQFNSKETIQTRACEWIAAIDRGLSAAEKNELSHWLGANNSHQKVLLEMAALWDDMSIMSTLQGLIEKHPASKSKKRAVWPLIASAAAITLCAVLSWQWLARPVMNAPQMAEVQQSSTQVGEQKTISLADGSKVFLNTDTAIKVSFFSEARRVELLKGEAHFAVAKNPERPFTVIAGSNSVTAVGTAFNMQFTQQQAFELTVTEGKVRVSKQELATNENAATQASVIEQEGVMVFAGEKVLVADKVSDKQSLTQSEIAQSLAWQDGQIVFTGENLTDVLSEIGRYTQVQFVIDDAEIKSTRVAGYFRVGDIKGLLAALENSFAISAFEDKDNRIHLRAM
ncbi:FecR family protein [Alteromonas lipolytica]|uniref:Uncharacterized protein n=1 Tax=Alteromonas lipolytica TaxID=1856405 RepID=A0A1E8FJ57_9ALTE|nr:FecR domain-containing protein [Alteromonas lipolytica]OFI35954.1 hypothetical protein BFC17_09725 [Alteromonas lipolytica]GGF72204.1 sensor [Alteromonas lipolytica]